jgi:hypothetical protein
VGEGSSDETADGNDLPPAAAIAAMPCRPRRERMALHLAWIVQIPHRRPLALNSLAWGQRPPLPSLIIKQVLCQAGRFGPPHAVVARMRLK